MGDPPAAMRYTETRLSKVSQFLIDDIDKKTVDFKSNYDETEKEPVVLPAQYPNLFSKWCWRYCRWYGNKHTST